jgi:hypothetical protein
MQQENSAPATPSGSHASHEAADASSPSVSIPSADGWVEWNGDAASIPRARGWVQFTHETREHALKRPVTQIDWWPWYGEDEAPCVLAYRLVQS